MKFNTIIVIFLSFFILYVIYYNFNTINVEGFSLSSILPDKQPTTDPQYQYLAPLADDNTWSQDTQESFIKKYNDYLLSVDPSATLITSTTINNINYMSVASEEEAKSYIENGIWPWDTYITNMINDMKTELPEKQQNIVDKEMDVFAKKYPNRLIYKLIGSPTLPQTSILTSLNPAIGNGLVLPNKSNQNLICKYASQSTIKQPDGTNIVIPANGFYPYLTSAKNLGNINGTYTLDNTIYESIPGLAFDSSACNICGITDFNYLDNKNQCRFSLKTPEAYDIYSGLNSKSTPSSV